MTPSQEIRAQRIIDQQVAMSGQTLERLRQVGLTGEKVLQIDFFFNAPTKKAAEALIEHLEKNDCLNLSAEKINGFFSPKFAVKGQTYPTNLTTKVLAKWLPWIIVQGILYNCEFDGWGAEV